MLPRRTCSEVAVVIATRGRPAIVERTVQHLLSSQTVNPSAVFVSCVDVADAGSCADLPDVNVILSAGGLAAQRNAGLERVAKIAEFVVFFDDDFVADKRWIESAVEAFREDERAVAITGHVLADGVKGPGIAFDDAIKIISTYDGKAEWKRLAPFSPYGCNMAFRLSAVNDLRFDERLPLYGWLEDRDFGAMLARAGGSLVKISSAYGVHLGSKAGRLSGNRLGYSQVVNPVYMHKKGTMPAGLMVRQISRNFASNLFGAFTVDPYVDRIGRLKGNVRGFADLLMGRADPRNVINM